MAMSDTKLAAASTLELLIELMYEGEAAGIVPELKPFEPIAVAEIGRALESRHGKNCGHTFDSWFSWFQSDLSNASKEDRDTLLRMKEFKDKSDPLFRRAREQLE